MADSTDNVSSWPGLLNQLNKTFLLIRDLFGYALPGGVFLAIGLISGRFSLVQVQNLLNWYHPPVWAVFIVLVVTCYVVGDVMAAIAYTLIAIRKWFQWRHHLKEHWYPVENQPQDFEKFLRENAKKIDWLTDNPTEVTGDLLEIRSRHPEFFLELDRRETLLLLSASNAIALLGGTLVFYVLKPPSVILFLIAGTSLLPQFFTGISHLRRVRWAVREADEISERRPKASDAVAEVTLTESIKEHEI